MHKTVPMNRSVTGWIATFVPLVLSAQFGYNTVDTHAGTGTASLMDGLLGSAAFNYPYGVCFDQTTNTIYVADAFNNCIRRIQGGVVTTVAGNGTVGDVDAQGANARFDHPTGVFYKNGYLYIADNYNNKIKRMDGTGLVETIAGSGSAGASDGVAALAEFYEPKSIAVDDSGTVFIADYENHMIRMLKDGIVSTIAGTGSAGDGLGPALLAHLHRPRDLCVDAAGNIYFVDLMNNKVKVLTTAGTVELVAGSGTAGTADGTGATAQFNHPVGIDWLVPGVLLVLDSFTPKVRRVTVGGVVNTIAGSGATGYVDGLCALAEFDLPQDVCVDNIGNIYVGDRNNNVIRVISHALPQGMDISQDLNEGLSVFPNPTSAELVLEIPELGSPPQSAYVVDVCGRVVLLSFVGDIGFGNRELRLDVSVLPSAQYFVSVTLANGRSLRAAFQR